MTVDRAKELAIANGCTFAAFGNYFRIRRRIKRGEEISYQWTLEDWRLVSMSEADFVASLPDKRD